MTRAQQKRKREEGLGTKIVRRELKASAFSIYSDGRKLCTKANFSSDAFDA